MHLANFWDHITNQLMLIDIDAKLAVSLAPHLKQAQLKAMLSGNEYIPILPEFEISHPYQSWTWTDTSVHWGPWY